MKYNSLDHKSNQSNWFLFNNFPKNISFALHGCYYYSICWLQITSHFLLRIFSEKTEMIVLRFWVTSQLDLSMNNELLNPGLKPRSQLPNPTFIVVSRVLLNVLWVASLNSFIIWCRTESGIKQIYLVPHPLRFSNCNTNYISEYSSTRNVSIHY